MGSNSSLCQKILEEKTIKLMTVINEVCELYIETVTIDSLDDVIYYFTCKQTTKKTLEEKTIELMTAVNEVCELYIETVTIDSLDDVLHYFTG